MLLGTFCCIRGFFLSSSLGKITLISLGLLLFFPVLAESLFALGFIAYNLAWTYGAVTLFVTIAAIYIIDSRLSS